MTKSTPFYELRVFWFSAMLGTGLLSLSIARQAGLLESIPVLLCALLCARNLGAKQVRAELLTNGEGTVDTGGTNAT